ncbi:MAG: GldG family protein [Syntrophobacterales bacterium]|nr:GldG family protein [Syntrophobacterales bacterium]
MAGYSQRKRRWTYGLHTTLSIVLVAAILGLIGLIAERHPLRWDLTKSKTHTLSDQSKKILEGLTQEVKIIGFFGDDESKSKAQDLFENYRYVSKLISYEFVDPDRNPELAKKYEIKTYGTAVLEGYGRKETVTSLSEESITNALLKLTRAEKKKIYFVVGHGEHSIEDFGKEGYSTARSSLEKDNYIVEKLVIAEKREIPEDAAVVVIAGPKKDLLPEEIQTIERYLRKGGRLVVMLDPYHDGGLKNLLGSFGFELSEDMIVDKLSRIFGGSPLMPVVTQYGIHTITNNFNVLTFYPEARSIKEAQKKPETVTWTALAQTSEAAWGETNRRLLEKNQANFEEKEDIPGPVIIAAIAEINLVEGSGQNDTSTPKSKETKSFVTVFGDSDFASNTYFGIAGNGDLFLNTIHYLAEEQNLITIERRAKEGEPLVLTSTQMRLTFIISMVTMPILVVVVASYVYMVRRSQR